MEHVQVLVVGGSVVGLSAALFLAAQDVRAVTVERHADSSPHPRAIGYTIRTMELLRQVGLVDHVPMMPVDFRLRRAKVTCLADPSAVETTWTPSSRTGRSSDMGFSPVRGAAIAQDRLEPLLRGRARDLGADIRPSTELVSFGQDAAGVTALVRDRVTGDSFEIRAEYLIACDGGGSPIREALNLRRSGRGHIRTVRSVLFRADLSDYLASGIRQWEIEQPDLSAFLTTYDDGRWVLMFTDDVERGEADLEAAIRRAIGRDDLPLEILTTGRWDLTALVADRFSSGRVFLAGDAAHQLPPTRGGYGANTGIHDVHNLAWKLRAVLAGASGPALLDTYDAERRPVAWTRHQQIFVRPDYAADIGDWVADESVLDDEAVELGQLYRSTAIAGADALLPAALRPDQWRGQPGTRAPHVPIAEDGVDSLLDLFGTRWILVAADGAWRKVVADGTGSPSSSVAVIGEDIRAPAGIDIAGALGIGEDGASLVRPDGYVAWRADRLAEAGRLPEMFERLTACDGARVLERPVAAA